jgi:hypothetical protein
VALSAACVCEADSRHNDVLPLQSTAAKLSAVQRKTPKMAVSPKKLAVLLMVLAAGEPMPVLAVRQVAAAAMHNPALVQKVRRLHT